MKTTLSIILASIAVIVTAQTITQPQPIDWRSHFVWEDPNPPGAASSWTAYASNSAAIRMAQTKVLDVSCQALLNGAPAGMYALFAVAFSDLGDVGSSTNLFVRWPGGDGKIKGGKNLQVIK